MATYNWSIRPNVPNRFGWVIADGAEDEPSGDGNVYVALFGNDETGNGSREKPFRNPKTGNNTYNIMASGVYRGITYDFNVICDGDVVVDNTILGSALTTRFSYGLTTRTNQQHIFFTANSVRINSGYIVNLLQSTNVLKSIFDNSKAFPTIIVTDSFLVNVSSGGGSGYNTFVNSLINFAANQNNYVANNAYFSIFENCDIVFSGFIPRIDYSLFYNCRFKSEDSSPDWFVPSDLVELIDFLKITSPTLLGWSNCIIADPKFNNPTVGDYSLAFDSPAKNSSYLGTSIGALSIGYAIKADATEADGDFDFSTNVNLTIADNAITMANPNLLASIESKVKPNLIGRELAEAPIFGFYADRNGQYIDSIADLSLTTVNSAQPLSTHTPYIVEVGSITYEGDVILAGERFTTTDETSFTTDAGGICREILEAPQRHTIMARFSDGGAIKIAGDALTTGYWYYAMGTLIYNGNTYTNEVFKATDTSPFTGSGQAREAMTDQVYQHYEPNVKFTSNNVGDVRTGAILRGNGDPDYERGEGKEFPINARFIQIKYILQPNNLKP